MPSIIAIAGANFWPWIMLNLAIAFIVAKPFFEKQPLALRLVATAFIVFAPRFVHVTKLGWFDSGVNNKLFFVAVDHNGARYPVPENFFTFYSYPIAHMDYGPPDGKLSFPVWSPNGGTASYQIFSAGRACDSQALLKLNAPQRFWGTDLADFVRNYHQMVLEIYRTVGAFPYDLYPHHSTCRFLRAKLSTN